MAELDPRVPLLQFSFASGIDEGTRDELLEPGTAWAVLENGRQDKRGGYSTRHGFTALSNGRVSGSARSVGRSVFAHRNTICVSDGDQVDVYDSVSAKWSAANRPPSCAMRIVDMPSVTDSTVEDVEYCNGYFAVAWRQTTATVVNAVLSVTNATTGASVFGPELIAQPAGMGISLTTYGNYFMAVMAVDSGATKDIRLYYLDTTSSSTIATGWVFVGGAAVFTDVYTTLTFAACSLETCIAFAYIRDAGGGNTLVAFATANIAGVIASSYTAPGAGVIPSMVDIAGTIADTLWVAWNQTTSLRLVGLDAAALGFPKASAATITTAALTGFGNVWIAPSSVTGKGRLFVSDASSTAINVQRADFKTLAGVAAIDGSVTTLYNVNLCGRPLQYGGRYLAQMFYAGAAHANEQKCTFLVDTTENDAFLGDYLPYTVQPLANPAPSLSLGSYRSKGKIVAGAVATKLYWSLSIQKSGVASATALVECDFASELRSQPVAHARSTFMPGGVLSVFDGHRVTEAGFLNSPTKPTTTATGTGITASTGWKYVVVWEIVDANGNWIVSGLSDPSASTGAVSNKTVNVSVSALTITSRQPTFTRPMVRAAFYRTIDGGALPYYRVGTVLPLPLSATSTYADTTTDANLIAGAKLYSQPAQSGTAQDRRGPPGMSILTAYNGMLVGAYGSDVWYSGQDVSGEGTWFSPIFQVPIPGDGDITALWVLDGTLIAAKRRELYALSGEAPTDNGSSGGLGSPRRLSVDVGAISQISCSTTLGTFFQSERGIEILTRAGSVEWIGQGIQETASAYPICTAMTVEPVSNTVLVELAASSSGGIVTGAGRTAVYDLTLRLWVSTDRRASSASVADTPAQSACMVYTGSAYRYAWLGANGVLYYEDTSDYLEADGTFIAKRAVSAHVKAAGPQGHQHVNKALLLARYHTAHDVSMSFAYDYSGSYKTPRVYTAADLAALVAIVPNQQLEHSLHDDAADCEAVRIQLLDVTPSSGTLGTGRGATWVNLAFEVVPKQGAYSLPDEAR